MDRQRHTHPKRQWHEGTQKLWSIVQHTHLYRQWHKGTHKLCLSSNTRTSIDNGTKAKISCGLLAKAWLRCSQSRHQVQMSDQVHARPHYISGEIAGWGTQVGRNEAGKKCTFCKSNLSSQVHVRTYQIYLSHMKAHTILLSMDCEPSVETNN
jgi:hypothetical protein